MVKCIRSEDGKAWIHKTHTNPLSRREVEELRKNPYIASVTATTVRFTEEFKKLAYRKKRQGVPVAETMRQCGIDPEVLGASRVEGFSYTLNRKAKQENSFSDGRSENCRHPATAGEETVEQRVRRLENELAYTRQEVEFLKNCRRQIWRLRSNGNPGAGRSEVRPHPFCPIRQANPYRRMAKAMKTSHVAKNEINRQFRSCAPRKALLTDITYLFYRGGVCYLSPILDVCTHEVLAYRLSDNLRVDFVLDMVDDMCSKYGAELDDSTVVHSDQGCHYTSNAFIRKLRDASFVQSGRETAGTTRLRKASSAI